MKFPVGAYIGCGDTIAIVIGYESDYEILLNIIFSDGKPYNDTELEMPINLDTIPNWAILTDLTKALM